METWLSPFASVWKAAYPSAQVPFKQLAQVISPLLKAQPAERVLSELAAYLQKTPPQFVNLHKFAWTFGSWNVQPPSERKSLGPSYLSVDECDRRAGIPVK